MKRINFVILSLYALASVIASEQTNSTLSTNSTSDEANFSDANGRSLLSSLEELPRQGRIINDEKISIKGFIPIVGIGSNSNDDNKNTQNDERNYNQQQSNDYNGPNSYDDQAASNSYPQHHSRPEDQRFIGAVLQGLVGNAGSLIKPNHRQLNRKSDCVCVPFYMCKNGFIVGSSSDPYNGIYQQRKQTDPTQDDGYLPINERSYENSDLNNTKFAEEILGRMIGRQSISDRCGLLRTCCQRSPMISNEQLVNVDYISPEIPAYGQSIYQPGLIEQQPPFIQPPYQPGSFQPSQQQLGGYQPSYQPGLPNRLGPYRPPKLINQVHSQQMPSYDSSIPVPIRSEPYRPQHQAYQNCGQRQSIGINGRVQNLNYHQSSTEFAEFPWQVAILKRIGPTDNLYVCGGALISPNFVLTAAHCIKKFQSHDLKIRLGEWDVHREDEFYPYVEKNVDEIFVHPHFTPRNLMNDVALLRMDTEIDLNQHPHISPICMPQPMDLFTGQRCYVAGWGKNAFGQQGEYQSVLMKVDLPVLDSRVCENLLKRTKLGYGFRLDRSMICAGGEQGKDACEGDGGSGLVCEVNGIWKVAGLVSWGLGCGQPGVPGVYTNIGNVRPWIDKIVLPYYSNPMANRPMANFNELINERSLANGTNIIANATQTDNKKA